MKPTMSLARWPSSAAAAGYAVAIVTGDKDFFQLVRDGIRVFNPRDEGVWYDAGGVKEKLGVTPEQVVDALALMGDTHRQREGSSGHRRERRSRPDFHIRDARRAPGSCPGVSQRKYREALISHSGEARAEPRAACGSIRMCR